MNSFNSYNDISKVFFLRDNILKFSQFQYLTESIIFQKATIALQKTNIFCNDFSLQIN